jgi:hypothetical protein
MSATQTQTASSGNVVGLLAARASTVPLRRNNLMDQYTHLAVTPGMGEEFSSDLQLSELLKAPNADALIQDLAVLSEPIFTEFLSLSVGTCTYFALTLQSPNAALPSSLDRTCLLRT